jgi:hypothetical protein
MAIFQNEIERELEEIEDRIYPAAADDPHGGYLNLIVRLLFVMAKIQFKDYCRRR